MDQTQVRRQFFSEQNEQMLYGMLSKNFQQRLGAPLNEKQNSHLERALEHYMSDVFQQTPTQPVPSLNKHVLTATATEFNAYLQRQSALLTATPQMFQETSNRYEQVQQDRQRSLEAPRPSIPDYVQPIQLKEDDSVSALTLFEEAKKRRGAEMNAQADADAAKRSAQAGTPIYAVLEDRPDPRVMFDRPLDLVVSGRADVNPTIARAPMVSVAADGSRGTLQQDMIIKQQDIQTYKESEYNLAIYSADRKWEFNANENRYNFSVNLYSGNPTNGVSIMPKATARFRNIVKIEFVKAVMPIENTDVIVRKVSTTTTTTSYSTTLNSTAFSQYTPSAPPTTSSGTLNFGTVTMTPSNSSSSAVTYDSTFNKNIFGYPYITLNVDELDTNNFGTNDTLDNAFGILQYDANWTDNTDSIGFTSYIPKHMKCQRVYSPTPLAALTKLTVRLQQPNGNLVSSSSDTLDINGAPLSITADLTTYNASSAPTTLYVDATGEYIWIDCKKWFSRYQIAGGDRIQIRGLAGITSPTAAQTDFLNYLQDASGLMVVATATTTGVEYNSAGYAKYIIVRSKFGDPTTGSTSVAPFGGAASNATLSTFLKTFTFTGGRLINLSHQTQLIFRVITRDYDSTSLVRPDNL